MSVRRITALVLILWVSVWAAETYDIERWAVGAVGLGWAGFGAALAGPTEYMINPAGLGNAERTEIIGTWIPDFAETATPCFGAALVKPMRTESASLGEERTFGTLAVSIFNAADSHFIGGGYYPCDWPPRGGRTPPDWSFEGQSLACISFGSRASDLFAYGLNLKVLSIEDNGRADSGFGLDAGMQLYPGDFRVGLSLINLIPPGISLADERSFAERVIRFGAGYSLFGVLTLAAELEYYTSLDWLDYGLCTEIVPVERDDFRIALGGGYRVREELWGGFLSLRFGIFEVAIGVRGRIGFDRLLPSSIWVGLSPEI
ncbi:conjugal transfer protein TraF [bacterium]|nr:conjugal transfer protein TraF [bacterium]